MCGCNKNKTLANRSVPEPTPAPTPVVQRFVPPPTPVVQRFVPPPTLFKANKVVIPVKAPARTQPRFPLQIGISYDQLHQFLIKYRR